MPGGNSECEPPDPIPNSEVKPLSADDSVGSPHVKVGHCQVYIRSPMLNRVWGFFIAWGGRESAHQLRNFVASRSWCCECTLSTFGHSSPPCESRVRAEKAKANSLALARSKARSPWRGPDHCQVLNTKPLIRKCRGFFLLCSGSCR